MQHILEDLNKTPGVVGSFIVDTDGIIVASDVSSGADADRTSALVSALTNAADKSLSRLGAGALTSAFFEMNEQKVFLQSTPLGNLVALALPESNLGLIRLEMRRASQSLQSIAPVR